MLRPAFVTTVHAKASARLFSLPSLPQILHAEGLGTTEMVHEPVGELH